MFQDVKDRVLGRRNSVPAQVLADALRVLKVDGGDQHERAVAFVLEGSGPEILSDLASRPTADLDQLLQKPGSLSPYAHWVPQQHTDRLTAVEPKWTTEQGVQARVRFYSLGDVTVPQLVRLGRLLAAVCEVARASEALPAWLAVLVNDVATEGYGSGHAKVTKEVRAALRARWTPELLVALARDGGVADAEAVPVVVRALLERESAERSWVRHHLGDLLPPAAEFLASHQAAVAEAVPTLTSHGRVAFCEHVKAAGTLEAHAGLVATLAADPAKSVREAADALLATLPDEEQVRLLTPFLLTAPPARLAGVVTRLAAAQGGLTALEVAVTGATEQKASAARLKLLTQTIERAHALEAGAEGGPDATTIDVPPYEPLAESDLGPDWPVAARRLLDEHIVTAKQVAENAKKLPDANPKKWPLRGALDKLKRLSEITDDDLRRIDALLSGREPVTAAARRKSAAAAWWLSDRSLVQVPNPTLLHRLRVAFLVEGSDNRLWWKVREHLGETTDLRQLHEALAWVGVQEAEKAIEELVFHRWWGVEEIPARAMWAYFAGRVETLDRFLGRSEGTQNSGSPARVLQILGEFPALPPVLLPRVTAIALGEGKTHRLAAQRALESHAGARTLAEQGLSDGKSEIRITAAAWLARLGDPASVPALRAALSKERREAVRAAFLTALESLGADISADLAPDVLLAEATKGLRARMPASLGWFPFEGLPELRWATGDAVPREIARWWVVLACKLKDPSGEGLLARYVSLLDEPSRTALGSFVLRAWVAQDTRNPTVDESRRHAEASAQQRYDNAQRYAKQYPQYYEAEAAKSVEDHYRELFREHQGTYLGSAVKDKGLLALTVGARGAELAAVTQQYLKTHQGRRSQAEALVRALAANGDRAAVQQLLAVSRRFKQKTVQEVASHLAKEIADRRGWSADQLADRTVQTAGFDDDGILRFDLGGREVTGRITPSYTVELRNAEGKVVKALPAQRAGDDAEEYAAAKAQLATSRKELKAVVTLQTQRLYEAMCTGRTWTAEEWREFVLDHPVMSRLAARLVWLVAPGTDAQRAFRPGDGGALIAVDDEDVTLPDPRGPREVPQRSKDTSWGGGDGVVALAHAVTLASGSAGDDAAAWREHLADYEIAPLFDQLGVTLPELAKDALRISDHRGWLTDSFSVRGRATKLGYSRSQAEDAGWFTSYLKEYPSAGITVEIEFTGAFLPEENIAAAVTDLVFRRTGTYGDRGLVPVADVPPVLVAEAYRDYVTVAEAGAFDAAWEKKSEY
ncbi:DUF4132 domain-containing protein [Antribacter gilvus]|uniref:DUF4132 domain-containing protein n=1 Tax=Antribacter gilvus TaxID=2304675 RepID=UPI000F76C095|nr:DUF4132 domain-containing protein [Antribacter gilvus]